jgi:pimeloyl-ACP methyl ester carboxylesterase
MNVSFARIGSLMAGSAMATILSMGTISPATAASSKPIVASPATAQQVTFGSVKIEGLNIAYREAGDPKKPKLVLLHGFPASSHQYRDLIPALADRFHVIAPDYQGFGNSDSPDPATYAYTFDALALTVEKFLSAKGFDHYGLFVQDYGGPVGFRLAGRHPEALDWLIVQNSNAYEEGFTKAWDGLRGALWKGRTPATEKPLEGFLTHDAIKSFYLHGAARPELVSPDNWESDYGFMQRPHSVRINLDLFYDYRTNVALYPEWQKFLRDRQPKTLIFWGQDDVFFTPEGGEAFLRDLPKAEMHRLAAGHFAIEGNVPYIASAIKRFHATKVAKRN